MIDFLRRLASFWLMLLVFGTFGYFCMFNLDYIYVSVPHIADVKVRAAVAYLGVFFAGASVVVFFFGLDAFKKSWIIRMKNRRIRQLEKQLAAHGIVDHRKASSAGIEPVEADELLE